MLERKRVREDGGWGGTENALVAYEERLDELLHAIAAEDDDEAALADVPVPSRRRTHGATVRASLRRLKRAEAEERRWRPREWTPRIASLSAAATFALCAAGSALLLPGAPSRLPQAAPPPASAALSQPDVWAVSAVALPWGRSEGGSWYGTVAGARRLQAPRPR